MVFMVEIVQKDNEILRDIAKEVPFDEIGSSKINLLLKDMSEALASQHDGVAIAAPQIGIPLRIFIISGKILADEGETTPDRVFINPVVKKLSRKKEEMDEGCLSVRWKYGTVKRAIKATVQAYDENGTLFTYNGTGLLAQIFQHETDHLDGILFIDKAKNLQDVNPEDLKQMEN
jgi:peptide deformylase